MHRLLDRQLRSFIGDNLQSLPKEFSDFINAVNKTYEQCDADRLMIERSLELMSRELNERNAALQQELSERLQAEDALKKEKEEQLRLIRKLEEAHNQLLQSEKMASIGQLAAGVAHEINNPIGYVNSNLSTLNKYIGQLLDVVSAYESTDEYLKNNSQLADLITRKKQEADFGYIKEDMKDLINESIEGVARVKHIVQDLKDFSRSERDQSWELSDIHAGLNSTLNVANNELKYKAEIIRDYGELPEIECMLSQLNQVFLNILVNAAQAIEEHGEIRISTRVNGEFVNIEFSDTGRGIPPDVQKRIFDPFFTTKPVGSGTGLGLSLSFSIISNHNGTINVASTPGTGTTFTIQLPIQQPKLDQNKLAATAHENL
jgi:two-component system NtrC family sensor kinase